MKRTFTIVTAIGIAILAAARPAAAGMVIDGFTAIQSLNNTSTSLPYRLMNGVCPADTSLFGGCRDTTLWLAQAPTSGDNTLNIGSAFMQISAATGNQIGIDITYDGNTDGNIGGSLDINLAALGSEFTLEMSGMSWDSDRSYPSNPLGEIVVGSRLSVFPFYAMSYYDFTFPDQGTSATIVIPFSTPTFTDYSGGPADFNHVNAIGLSLNQTNYIVNGLQGTVQNFDVSGLPLNDLPAVPEPVTFVLAGGALAAIAFLRKR
jgi:hypothetical protein